MSHSLWVEKYRPMDLSTYVGNEHLKEKVKAYLESEDVPHLLLFGKAGTGKTTLAKIVVNNIDVIICISMLLMKIKLMMSETKSKHLLHLLVSNP